MIKAEDIAELLNELSVARLPRDYLGLSSIGTKCYRKLQHDHYWTYKSVKNKRVRRLLNFGKMMEPIITADLADIGIYVMGTQDEYVGFAGHWKGHSDGRALVEIAPDKNFLVEFKTHNDKNYQSLVKLAVQKAFPSHYDQMTSYLGYSKLPWCLYIGYNKDDSEYYAEIVLFDEERFIELKRKEQEIILATDLLPKIGNGSETWFECKLCNASAVCHGKEKVEQNCRTCANVDVVNNGQWVCSIGKGKKMSPVVLSTEEQIEGCEFYELSAMFK
jgi:hypothetical protein